MKKNDKVSYQGKVCVVFDVNENRNQVTLDTGMAPVLYETVDMGKVTMVEEYVKPATTDRELAAKQQDEATANDAKPTSELQVGDLLHLDEFGFKNDGGNAFRTMFSASQSDCVHSTLARIEKIVEATIEGLNSEKLELGKGGSQSDCLLEGADMYNLDLEQLATVYQLVTLVKFPDGRHLFVDRQGYDYPRYILASKDWREMFAEEMKTERIKSEEAESERKEYEKRIRDEEKANAEKYRDEHLNGYYPSSQAKICVKRILALLCPTIPFDVTQRSSGYTTKVDVYANSCNTDALKDAWDEFQRNAYYRTGRYESVWDDQFGGYETEISDCVVDGFFGYVSFNKDSKFAKVKEAPKPVEKPANCSLSIVDYSEKALAVIGDTKDVKDMLKRLGGKFNSKLSCGAGWIFSKKKEAELRLALSL